MAGLGLGPEFFVVGDSREGGCSQSWKFWWSFGKGLPNTEVTAGGRGKYQGIPEVSFVLLQAQLS